MKSRKFAVTTAAFLLLTAGIAAVVFSTAVDKVDEKGILEVVITEAQTGRPLENAAVQIHPESAQLRHDVLSKFTNDNGSVQVSLIPGKYKIYFVAVKGLGSNKIDEHVVIKAGQTTDWQYTFEGPPAITGTITDPEGNPLEGAFVAVKPHCDDTGITDEQGRFSVQLSKNVVSASSCILFASHWQLNLAGSIEVPPESQCLELQLSRGLIAKCRVTDESKKSLSNVTVKPCVRFRGISVLSDSLVVKNGNTYTWKGIPLDVKCSFHVTAEGYGALNPAIDPDLAVDGVHDLTYVSLPKANRSISGIVFDAERKPIQGACVHASGSLQPDNLRVFTGSDGRFRIDGVCEGRISLFADYMSSEGHKWGRTRVQAGATDAKIYISPSGSRAAIFVAKEAKSLIGKQLGDLGLFGKGLTADGKVMLCFFDITQRPSREMVNQLTEWTDQLAKEDVQLVLVQSSQLEQTQLDNWLARQQIDLPSGMVTDDDPDKTLKAWGVKSLPWLILTDDQGKVAAEGFRLAELSELVK